MAKGREITLQVSVTVPIGVGENDVETAINSALDEPPCEWEDWIVGAAIITNVKRVEYDDPLAEDDQCA